ncbi:MAG TPA: hypothetical protein VK984_02520 [Methyloceanibacter sp.]|nr:hypothetical protein [Methyloceanibacter sp.]
MSSMPHRALGRDLDQLVIAVVDNRRPMLAVIRAMLAAIGTGRVETYESPVDALDRMPPDLSDLVIAGAAMQPFERAGNGARHAAHELGAARARPRHDHGPERQAALRAGAHQVLVLPIAASTFYRRLDWLINDDRPF